MNEVIREFLIETQENLAQLDLDLVTLEKDPRERETLARVFRTLHTVKGTAGFLGLQKLQAVSHASENLLSRLRNGELIFNAEMASALLTVVDAIRQMLGAVEKDETDGDADFSTVIQVLERLQGGNNDLPRSHNTPPRPQSIETSLHVVSPVIPQVPPPPSPPPPSPQLASPPSPQLAPPLSPQLASPSSPQLASHPTTTVSTVTPVPQASEAAEPRSHISESSIRVDVGLLDKLMTLVGELVLARNQLMQCSSSQEDTPFLSTVQRLNLLTTELQAGVMKTRMQPIGTIWTKFPRVVRDLALACGKQASLEMEGQETELDKSIIEAIRDPLTHLIRNAIDHGIEPAAERQARGKAPEGRLTLHAFHEGGKVVIEIIDDGGGIDPQRIRAKAIEARLVTPEQADRLNERELVNLVFLAGFSTADQVTQFSGRGVGMDVVRTNIEKIGGMVTIESRLGRGTTVRMKIPLTLAIIPALTIRSAGDRYAIPQVSLLELVRLEGEQAQRGIEWMHNAPVYRLRGNLLPVVYLNRLLHPVSAAVQSATARRESEPSVNIVVLQADDRQFGLVVDEIHDTEEIVVKPMQKLLKDIGVFAGATIMGDGKVALILDVLGLAQKASVISGVRERALSEKRTVTPTSAADHQTVLLFASRTGGRMAIPLSMVARLEEFPRSAVERVGPQYVVQYRDEILPLIHVSRVLRPRQSDSKDARRRARHRPHRPSIAGDGDKIQVVVYSSAGQRVGLVVDRILDIAEETIVSRSAVNRPGVLFSAVIQGQVTEFLDMEGIIHAADPDLVEPPQAIAGKA